MLSIAIIDAMVVTVTDKPTHGGSGSEVFCKKSRTGNFRKINRKTLALENFFRGCSYTKRTSAQNGLTTLQSGKLKVIIVMVRRPCP